MRCKTKLGSLLGLSIAVLFVGTSPIFGQGGVVVPKNRQEFLQNILQQQNPVAGLQNPGVANPNPNAVPQNQPNINPWTNIYNNPGGAGVNPWTPNPSSYQSSRAPSYNPYPYPYYPFNPYYPMLNPVAGSLFGQAALLSAGGEAYATIITSQEKARYDREVAEQMKLQTYKMRFDLKRYIEENTPPLSERILKTQKQMLERIQKTANVTEILNGKSLNVLLEDYQKHRAKKYSVPPLNLNSEILQHLNVTASTGNLGLLKNNGRFEWPIGMSKVLDGDEKKNISIWAEELVQQAVNGKVQQNTLSSLREALDAAREKLLSKVNELRTSQYLESKRFMDDFDQAYTALKKGDAIYFFAYQKFASQEHTVEELFSYMTDNGLTFAAATQGDRHAYLAAHANAAAFSMALNNQVIASK